MEQLIAAIAHYQDGLQVEFERAIRESMHEAHASAHLTGSKAQEPDFVAMLILKGVPLITQALRAALATVGITAKVTSVFCHQRPLVSFNLGHDSCELGDILLVHRHTNRTGEIYNNSLLLQAKISNDEAPQNIGGAQLRLYKNWPEFTYMRSGPKLNHQRRKVTPNARHSGAQYLLIDGRKPSDPASGMRGLPGTFCMSVFPAQENVIPFDSLAEELTRFFVGKTGRLFVDKPSDDPTEWSTLVWDLLEHGANFVFNRRNIGVRNTPRASGDAILESRTFCAIGHDESALGIDAKRALFDYILSLRGDQHNDGNPPNDNTNWDEFGGVSIILIDTSSSLLG